MKILNDATSPFGRKAVVVAMERSIAHEEIFVDLNTAALDQWNPLRQIPTLVLPNGKALYDSDVIVQFLDRQHKGPPLIPDKDAPAVLTRMSLANGLMEATLGRLIETRRPAGERSDALIAKLEARIWRVFKAMNADISSLAGPIDALRADQITAAVALAYADFRFNNSWQAQYPVLNEWRASIAARRSMALTAPTRTSPVPTAETQAGR